MKSIDWELLIYVQALHQATRIEEKEASEIVFTWLYVLLYISEYTCIYIYMSVVLHSLLLCKCYLLCGQESQRRSGKF